MTQKIVTTCDRCKAKSKGEPALTLTVWTVDRESFDICSDCLLEMIAWIKNGVSS